MQERESLRRLPMGVLVVVVMEEEDACPKQRADKLRFFGRYGWQKEKEIEKERERVSGAREGESERARERVRQGNESEEGKSSAHQDDDDDTGACHSLKAAAGIIYARRSTVGKHSGVFRCPRREC